jgi:hypothetical protein
MADPSGQLYAEVDTEALQVDAESSLLYCGFDFNEEIITHAKGDFIYTSTGRRILDV